MYDLYGIINGICYVERKKKLNSDLNQPLINLDAPLYL